MLLCKIRHNIFCIASTFLFSNIFLCCLQYKTTKLKSPHFFANFRKNLQKNIIFFKTLVCCYNFKSIFIHIVYLLIVKLYNKFKNLYRTSPSVSTVSIASIIFSIWLILWLTQTKEMVSITLFAISTPPIKRTNVTIVPKL